VIEGSDLKPEVTDNFLMVRQPVDGSHAVRVVFTAEACR
jgi:hypothetical protein